MVVSGRGSPRRVSSATSGCKKVAASALVIGLPLDCSYLNLLSPPESTVMANFLFSTRVRQHESILDWQILSFFSNHLLPEERKKLYKELELNSSTFTCKQPLKPLDYAPLSTQFVLRLPLKCLLRLNCFPQLFFIITHSIKGHQAKKR